jgi:hypothetical protein
MSPEASARGAERAAQDERPNNEERATARRALALLQGDEPLRLLIGRGFGTVELHLSPFGQSVVRAAAVKALTRRMATLEQETTS